MDRKIIAVAVVAVIVVAAAACAVVLSNNGGGNGGSGSSDEGYPRTITDAAGYEITLNSKPQKLALLHTVYLDYFLSLGVYPSASAGASTGTAIEAINSSEIYAEYRDKISDITDLGSALTINLDAVATADPDVIVTFSSHAAATSVYEELSKVAPVILIDFSATWQEQLAMCAEIFGLEDKAKEVQAEIESGIESIKASMSSVTSTVAVLKVSGNSANNIWEPAKYETFGLTSPDGWPSATRYVVSLEALVGYDPDYIFLVNYTDVANAWISSMEEYSSWSLISAVQNDHVIIIDDAMQSLGPLSYKAWIAELQELFL